MKIIPNEKAYTWESQVCQFPETGEPGITLDRQLRPGFNGGTWIDVLLYRNETGKLVGIFYHYNENNLWQNPGDCNLFVDPDHRRQGVGTALLREADQRWELADQDTYTEAGNAWIEGLVAKGSIDPARTGSIEDNPRSISARKVLTVNATPEHQKG